VPGSVSPMNWGVVVRAGRVVGIALVAAGLLLLAFVAYQLWGTNLIESHHQAQLRDQFNQELQRSGQTTTTTRPQTTTTLPSTPPEPVPVVPPPAEGNPLATIVIPKLGVDAVVVQGVGTSDLMAGPGHYPGTSLPGEGGNAAIAGHRTTYGAPFSNLDQLSAGDTITITTLQGTFVYRVSGTSVVDPTDLAVIGQTNQPTLTLTTCTPKFSAAQRLIVTASLVAATPASGGAVSATTTPPPPAGTAPPVHAVLPADNLASMSGDWVPAVLWGVLAAAVLAGTYLLVRWRRRWRIALIGAGALAFVVVLYLFFGALSPLLPASF
jgi:sortase A